MITNAHVTKRIDHILYQKEKSVGMKILLFPLYLLSLPYGCAIRLRMAFYTLNLLKSKALFCPVISVGNIVVGGTGKTPLVMTLARRLKERGIPVAILSRGYKGMKTSEPVLSDGERIFISPQAGGDEPYLMAKRLKDTPVLVGRDRYLSGRIAVERFGARGVILDDGFQHLRLQRDLNIMLVDSAIGFGDGHLLPRGLLREPLSHIRRADIILMTRVEDLRSCQTLEHLLRSLHPSAPVFHSNYEPVGLIGPGEQWDPVEAFKGKSVLAFSGIANPLSFSSLLKKCGMKVIREAIFPDHHRYTREDLASLSEMGKKAEWILTTEKDLVRLAGLEINAFPIRALRIEMRVWEEAFFQQVMNLFWKEKEKEADEPSCKDL